MKKLLLNLLVLCALSTYAQSSLTINFKTLTNERVYLEKLMGKNSVRIDSAIINNKTIVFKIPATETAFYRLIQNKKNFVFFIISPNEKVIASLTTTNLKNGYKVKGSKFGEHLNEFYANQLLYEKNVDSASIRYKRAIRKGDTVSMEKQRKIIENSYTTLNKSCYTFIDKYSNSPAIYFVKDFLILPTDLAYLKKIQTALQATMPNNEATKLVNEEVKKINDQLIFEENQRKAAEENARRLARFQPGKPCPDIIMKDTNNIERKLSSLKGNVVLVDFWASWCGPCRKENPNVVRLYNKYKDKGFTVYSVSLDNPGMKKKWIDAIQKDGLVWSNHVSELKGWQTSVLSEFGITGIPYTILLDKEGNIIKLNARGIELEAELAKVFGF